MFLLRLEKVETAPREALSERAVRTGHGSPVYRLFFILPHFQAGGMYKFAGSLGVAVARHRIWRHVV